MVALKACSLILCSYFLLYFFIFSFSSQHLKRGVLQLALQLNFWIVKYTCNSVYLYIVSVNGQVAWVVELQLIVCMVQLIATQLQFNQNNLFLTTIQFHYNYTYDVMLMSLIVIHLLKFDMWPYEDFWILKFFEKFDLHHPLWLLTMVWDCDMGHNKKITTWHINYILENYIYIIPK